MPSVMGIRAERRRTFSLARFVSTGVSARTSRLGPTSSSPGATTSSHRPAKSTRATRRRTRRFSWSLRAASSPRARRAGWRCGALLLKPTVSAIRTIPKSSLHPGSRQVHAFGSNRAPLGLLVPRRDRGTVAVPRSQDRSVMKVLPICSCLRSSFTHDVYARGDGSGFGALRIARVLDICARIGPESRSAEQWHARCFGEAPRSFFERGGGAP